MQNGHPRVTSNACQLVLKYILLNKVNLAKAWRTRIYYYSSGTLFQTVTGDLVKWLDNNPDGDVSLRQVRNDNGLFEVLSGALFDFFISKGATFPRVGLSRQHFWSIPSWKRALTGVYMVRFVFDMSAQKAWNKFRLDDLKFNTRMFSRFMEKEVEVYSCCAKLKALPYKLDDDTGSTPIKRTRSYTSVSDTESPVKRVFTVNLVTTSESESEEEDGEEDNDGKGEDDDGDGDGDDNGEENEVDE